MINSKMIFRILGFLLLIETAMLLCCGGVSLFYKENDLQSFLISSARHCLHRGSAARYWKRCSKLPESP